MFPVILWALNMTSNCFYLFENKMKIMLDRITLHLKKMLILDPKHTSWGNLTNT